MVRLLDLCIRPVYCFKLMKLPVITGILLIFFSIGCLSPLLLAEVRSDAALGFSLSSTLISGSNQCCSVNITPGIQQSAWSAQCGCWRKMRKERRERSKEAGNKLNRQA